MNNRISIALCCLMLPTLALAIAAAGAPWSPEAQADAGAPTYHRGQLGTRNLRMGDRGADVRTLNWALRSEALGTPAHDTFAGKTDRAVRSLQRDAGLKVSGVVARHTRKAVAARMIKQRATWYGPGLYGNRTACGRKLTPETIGVAHRKLPCGTRVVFAYRGHWVRARVIDRGPYRRGYRWDLTRALAKRLGALRAGTPVLKTGVAP